MRFYLYTLNTLADWEIAYITAEIRSGRFLAPEKARPTLKLIGQNLDAVTTMGGMTLIPEETLRQASFKRGDVLILPGADSWMETENREILSLIPRLLDEGVIVAAICGATMALAEAGILDKRRHTSNDRGYLEMSCPGYKGKDNYEEAPAVRDGTLITASGLAPLEFTRELLSISGVMRRSTLEAWYGLYSRRDPACYPALMESLR